MSTVVANEIALASTPPGVLVNGAYSTFQPSAHGYALVPL